MVSSSVLKIILYVFCKLRLENRFVNTQHIFKSDGFNIFFKEASQQSLELIDSECFLFLSLPADGSFVLFLNPVTIRNFFHVL